MGNRSVYCLKEDGKENYFYAHYGANSLSPLLRLWQAMEIRKQLPENQSLAHIFEHLDYDGGGIRRNACRTGICFLQGLSREK